MPDDGRIKILITQQPGPLVWMPGKGRVDIIFSAFVGNLSGDGNSIKKHILPSSLGHSCGYLQMGEID